MSRPSLSVPALAATLGLILGSNPSAGAGDQVPAERAAALFDAVRPLLVDQCLACHADDPRKGGLDLSRRSTALEGGESGAAIDPDDPAESLLLQKVEAGEMPPKRPLDPAAVETFRNWVAAGAPYREEPLTPRRAGPDWWSLRAVRRPSIPTLQNATRARNPIDLFVLAKLESKDLQPAPEADRPTLVRRLSLDLTGLPPTPEEVAGFVRDERPDAYERLVERLLASPRYGERWARHWLDVVRFAESHGYETNQLRPNAWPYRDYVIRAFNRDTPFAEFVLDQLAADTRTDSAADWLTQAATGFLVGGSHDVVGNLSLEGMLQQRVDDLDDMITATGTAFLGLTINCARCHDHKFDPITQRDYYGLSAVLSGTQHAERSVPAPDAERRRSEARGVEADLARVDRDLDAIEPLAFGELAGRSLRPPVDYRRNVERFVPVPARVVRFTTRATSNATEPCLDELELWTAGPSPRNVAQGATPSASSTYPGTAIHRLEHINDGRTGNAWSWISAEPGKGWVQLELPRVETIDRVVWGRDRLEQYRDRLPVDYEVAVATEPGQWRIVASSTDRSPFASEAAPETPVPGERAALLARQKVLRDRLASLGETSTVYAGIFQAPVETYVLRRGDPQQKGEVAAPSAVRAVAPAFVLSPDAPEPERRRALARWISDAANPLPARVMVNRVWHYHFGQGLVNTPSDFGFNGDPPSHPELLDWLAAEFLANGGRLKPLHRLIVLSATYRQSSRPDPKALAVDRNNRLLWRWAPRRLEAEEIRDAVLAVSGALDPRMGGPGYWIWEPNTNYVVVFRPLERLGPEHFRRMIYQYKPRSQPDPTFGAFDCPDGGLVAPRRNASTTALQALNLLNGPFLLDQAALFADRLRREAGDDPAAQVDRAFLLAFGRTPTETEQAAAVDLVRSHGTPAFARALYNASEFLYVP